MFQGVGKTSRFEILSDLALACLTLPHTSADLERVFSDLKFIKSDKRNRLLTDSVRNLVMVSNRKRSLVLNEVDFSVAGKRYQ